jgi:6-phosphofructokinase 1
VGDYKCEIIENRVADVANKEKTIPDEFIAEGGNDVTEAFINYCKPLIMGDVNVITEGGVPKHITR